MLLLPAKEESSAYHYLALCIPKDTFRIPYKILFKSLHQAKLRVEILSLLCDTRPIVTLVLEIQKRQRQLSTASGQQVGGFVKSTNDLSSCFLIPLRLIV